MARPSVAHGGFLIPNAGLVAEPLLSEPDRVDFNTMANARWGVISGCQVTGLGQNVIKVADGTAMVNGKFVYVHSDDLDVSIPSGLSKFDLIVTDSGGNPRVIPGRESNDPYFPDPPADTTVLAAVFCKTGLSLTDYVIDKRKFLNPALMANTPAAEDLIRNFKAPGANLGDPTQDYYRVLGDGTTTWSNDTVMLRSGEKTLTIQDNLVVSSALSAKAVSAEAGSFTGELAARNLRRATSPPPTPFKGDFWQNTSTGSCYIANPAPEGGLEWDEIATMGNMLPPGTVIMSMEATGKMINKGWLPLNGYQTFESVYPSLFTVASLAPYISGIAPNRTVILPNITSRMIMPTFTAAAVGVAGPTVGGKLRSTNKIKLVEGQMPKHQHSIKTASEAVRSATVIQATTGTHRHDLPDHSHKDIDGYHAHDVGLATVPVTVTPASSGANQVLTPPYQGQPQTSTGKNTANVQVGSVSGTIPKVEGGPHSHPVEDGLVSHYHDIAPDPFGKSPPDDLDLTNMYFTLYFYIRT